MWPSERTARFLLALLILAAPLGLGLRMLLAERLDGPRFPRPSATDFVLVTFGSWADPEEWPEGQAFRELARRGQRVGPLWATSDHAPAAAASLWTGRYPLAHGLRAAGERLPAQTWTLAAAARDAGTRTAAFLGANLVIDSGLAGFEQLVEDPQLGAEALGKMARRFLVEATDRRVLLWLHLEDAGEGGADAERLIGALVAGLVESGREPDTLLFVTALQNRLDAADEGRLLVPFVSYLPAALNAGRTSAAVLGHVDLAGLGLALLRLPRPSLARGEGALQSREQLLWSAMRGTSGPEWNWVEGSFGEVARLPEQRLHLAPDGSFRAERLPQPRALGDYASMGGGALENARRTFAERRDQAAGRQ